jgi:ribosomal protein L11 methylase PrmA
VGRLKSKPVKTTWDDYYTDTILGKSYLDEKTKLVSSYLAVVDAGSVIDLGANDGHFSLLCKDKRVVALDADANCIDELYRKAKKEKLPILPLQVNLLAPSPAIGWNNKERSSVTERLKADLVMALALVHHLAIAHNVPLPMIAGWLQPMAGYLLIEFVPKEDEKVQLLLRNREDIFADYSLPAFKEVFGRHYSILREEVIGNTGRVLFLLKRN